MAVRRVLPSMCLILVLLSTTSLPGQVSPSSLPVKVEIFEDVPAGLELNLGEHPPTLRYTEPAFGFVQIPTRYSANALALDRSTPFILRAELEQSLPAGEYQFRLRARGQSWFLIDGELLIQTSPQKPNTTGDDPVPPPEVVDESGRRPPPYPHQDQVILVDLNSASHRFTLVAVIGGKGLMPTPGELSVSYGPSGKVEHLLGSGRTPRLVHTEWESYASAAQVRHSKADILRRRKANGTVEAAWNARHEQVRMWVLSQPPPKIPEISPDTPVFNDIDRFVGARLEQTGTQPLPLTSDVEFLRRLTLDTVGVIPTAQEIRTFQAEPDSVRRHNAIERSLSDPRWADHWVAYWQDVLAENPGILKPDLNNTGPFRWWLHQSFLDGIPFDRLVTELIEMEGSVHKGAPAGFGQASLNDAPKAAKADIIFQAFQAKKLSCARCHNAPFHPFKQKDLFSLGAMLEGKALTLPETSTVPIVEGRRRPFVEITLKAGDVINPVWPFEENLSHLAAVADLPISTGISSRSLLAKELVSPQNKRFAQVLVNRLWKRYLGLGLVEPAGDWSTAEASDPDLLDYLAREFLLSGYDLKHVARLIFYSHVYQRKPDSSAPSPESAEEHVFAGPVHRRMTAEQVVDSLHLSVGKNLLTEELNLNPAGDRSPRQFLNLGKPTRAWQFTALSNERDRPALALPKAQSAVDVLTAFGWRQSRQTPLTDRDDAPRELQTLILANGVVGTRIVRLSDDSAITELCLSDVPLEELLNETFLRVLSRPPSQVESQMFTEYLSSSYGDRRIKGVKRKTIALETASRVSWSNHLSAEATLIRMEEERHLRMGDEPTRRLTAQFRERFEDTLWALINSPEFVLIP